jgi:hypothetical protein
LGIDVCRVFAEAEIRFFSVCPRVCFFDSPHKRSFSTFKDFFLKFFLLCPVK